MQNLTHKNQGSMDEEQKKTAQTRGVTQSLTGETENLRGGDGKSQGGVTQSHTETKEENLSIETKEQPPYPPYPPETISPSQGSSGGEKFRTPATDPDRPGEKSEPKGDGPQSRDPADLPDWIPIKDWNDFLEVRKSLGCPMTGISRARTLEALERLRDAGHDPGEVLNQSIVNGWKGVFPVRKTRRSVPGPQKTFDQIKVEKTRLAANRVLDEIYGPKEDSNGTISI